MASILATRLHVPAPAAETFARPRLMEQLQSGTGKLLTLVCAPAGFGKTTAVAGWLAEPHVRAGKGQAPHHVAWYSVADGDDFPTFVTYLVAAVRRCAPSLFADWVDLDRRSVMPEPEDLAAEIINRLLELPGRLYIVLDDYHAVTEEATHHFVAYFVRFLPPSVHLVIISRFDPPIGIAQLRGRGQVNEVRLRQLAFTEDEAGVLLQAAAGRVLDDQAINILWSYTEGWGVGLRLAAISLQDSDDQVQFVRGFAANQSRHIADYLLGEVLGSQPPAVYDFLLRTSILGRFCRDLCAATLGDWELRQVTATIEYLERRGLFLVQLDAFREWGRYHSQFRGLLHVRLTAETPTAEVAALHMRAAGWLARHDFVDEALHHYLAAGQQDAAVQLIVARIPHLMRRAQWQQAERLLKELPREVMAGEPALLLLRAWVFYNNTGYAQVRALTREAERRLAARGIEDPAGTTAAGDEEAAVLWGQVHAFRASPAFAPSLPAEGLAHAEAALRLLPASYGMVRAFAINFLGHQTLYASGYAAAVDVVQQQIAAAGEEHTEYMVRLAYAAMTLRYLSGTIDDLAWTAERYWKLAAELELPGHVQLAQTAAAIAHAERNARATATDLVNEVFARPDLATFQTLRLAAKLLVDVHGSRDKAPEVDGMIEVLRSRAQAYPNTYEDAEIEAMAAYVAACAGDLETAGRYVARTDLQPPVGNVRHEGTFIVATNLVLGEPHQLRAASELAERLLVKYAALNIAREQIELHVLLAKCYRRQGHQAAGLQHLRAALDLGFRRGYRHVFTGEPEIMGELLRMLRSEEAYRVQAESLLQEIARPAAPCAGVCREPMPAGQTSTAGPGEMLSYRELEVLELVATGLTNNEIAAQLVISPATVRNHTVKIFDKLQVRTRRAAVERAQQLGMLAK
jgi:LuxR family maltose regulon positive regulatory protein